MIFQLESTALGADEEAPSGSGKDWSRALRGFRSEHNFFINTGSAESHWKILKDSDEFIEDAQKDLSLQLSYAFHLQLVSHFGYYLGSSVGITKNQTRPKNFRILQTLILPGLDAGLVFEPSNNWRTMMGYTFGWQRLDSIRFDSDSLKASVTADCRSYHFSVDYFFELSDGVRVEYERFTLLYSAPGSLNIEKRGTAVKVGYLKHLI